MLPNKVELEVTSTALWTNSAFPKASLAGHQTSPLRQELTEAMSRRKTKPPSSKKAPAPPSSPSARRKWTATPSPCGIWRKRERRPALIFTTKRQIITTPPPPAPLSWTASSAKPGSLTGRVIKYQTIRQQVYHPERTLGQ